MMKLHLIAIIALLTLITTSGCIALQSPCPKYFTYILNGNVLDYGLIQVQIPKKKIIVLEVDIAKDNIQGYKGYLVIKSSREKVMENIVHGRPITYHLFFPEWRYRYPNVTKIILNGKLLCSGFPVENDDDELKLFRHIMIANIHPTHGPSLDPTATQPAIHSNATQTKGFSWIYPGKPVSIEGDNMKKHDRTIPNRDEAWRHTGVNEELCGRSVVANALVANGVHAQKGHYPWLSAIYILKESGFTFLCAGNLITRKHVVTAGHCMKPSGQLLHVDDIFLRLGDHNLRQWTLGFGSRTIGAAKIEVHPSYRPMSADADVAIITLADKVEYTALIRPICLWFGPSDLKQIVGRLGRVVGWGKDESNFQITPVPNQIDLPVVSQEDCLRSHSAFSILTSNRTFCAGFRNGSGPCTGDSGGGFILNQDNRWVLRGIVSLSLTKDRLSCDYSQYFVFSDITKVYNNWLLRAIS